MNIRKQGLILVIVLVFFSLQAKSQLFFGVKAGGTSSSIIGKNMTNFIPEQKMYFHGGVASSFSLNRRFAIQLELLYSGKGTELKYDGIYNGMSGTINYKHRLHYFAIPLMLQFKMGDRDNYFHFDGGVVHNSLIGNKFTGEIEVKQINGDLKKFDITSGYNPVKSDFSLAFGVGLVANGITFDFRYEIGQNQIYSIDVNSPEIYNRAFLVSVGYSFNLL